VKYPVHATGSTMWESFENHYLFTALQFASISYYTDKSLIAKIIRYEPISYKTVAVDNAQAFIIEFADIIVVSFRGRNRDNMSEIIEDLRCWKTNYNGYKTHAGFTRLIAGIDDTILTYLNTLDINKRLIYIGHSLGGALAQLLALKYPPSEIITFGSPAIGNNLIEWQTPVKTYRVTTANDYIISLPPAMLGYEHYGRNIILKTHGNKIQSHKIRYYTKSIILGDVLYDSYDNIDECRKLCTTRTHGEQHGIKRTSR